MTVLLPDPPVRLDGRCAVCPKPRLPERSRRYAGAEAETDPFCSNGCCRRWHGLPDLAAEAYARQRLGGRNRGKAAI